MKKTKKFVSILLALVLTVSSFSILSAVTASAVTDTKIYVEIPDFWGEVKWNSKHTQAAVYCHLYRIYGGSELKETTFATKTERCVWEHDNVYSFDTTTLGTIEDGADYSAIFCADNTKCERHQTCDMTMGIPCLGDTMTITTETRPNAVDSEKVDYLGEWIENKKKNAWGAAWGKIFKRELFHDNAFPCSNSMEDYQAVLPIMFEQEHIYYTEEALYMHFYNENSLTRRSFNPDMLQGLTVVQNLRNIFADKGASKDILRGVDYLKFVDLVFIINALWNTDTLGTGQLIKKMYEQTKPLILEALIYSKKKKHTLKEVVKLYLIILAVKLGRKNGGQK